MAKNKRNLRVVESDLLRRIDSLYAEYGDNVSRGDIEEQIKDYCR